MIEQSQYYHLYSSAVEKYWDWLYHWWVSNWFCSPAAYQLRLSRLLCVHGLFYWLCSALGAVFFLYRRVEQQETRELRLHNKTATNAKSSKSKSKKKQPKTLVVLGEVRKHVRGHVQAPLKKIKKRLLDRAYRGQKDVDVITVDEFRTTILCSQCIRR